MLVTHLSASTAALVWMTIEWVKFGRPGLVGTVTGLVAGSRGDHSGGRLGRSGRRRPDRRSCIGGLFFRSHSLIRIRLKIDDSLDVFAVHGVGGILGTC